MQIKKEKSEKYCILDRSPLCEITHFFLDKKRNLYHNSVV